MAPSVFGCNQDSDRSYFGSNWICKDKVCLPEACRDKVCKPGQICTVYDKSHGSIIGSPEPICWHTPPGSKSSGSVGGAK